MPECRHKKKSPFCNACVNDNILQQFVEVYPHLSEKEKNMSVCQNPPPKKLNPNCIPCNGGALGVYSFPPKCICNEPIQTCKKHGVKYQEYWGNWKCPECNWEQNISFSNIKKEETIIIKKELWDEMVEYKKKVDDLTDGYLGLRHEVKWIFEMLDTFADHKNRQIDENRKAFRHVEELEKKLKNLEEKINELNNLCNRIYN